MQPDSNVTYTGSEHNFELLWPGLDRTPEDRAAWDNLWAQIEAWKQEQRDRAQSQGELGRIG